MSDRQFLNYYLMAKIYINRIITKIKYGMHFEIDYIT